MTTAAARPTITQSAAAGGDGSSRVEDFLQSLARAVRHFHTYPASSPRCVEAVEDSHRALTLIDLDSITCVVSPRELLVGGIAIGRDTLVEQELARRLYESRCQTLAIDRSATQRDISRLCTELVARYDANAGAVAERLQNHRIERIQIGVAYQPEIFEIAGTAATYSSAEQDRRRRDAQPSAGRVAHLYPADKGWIRVDPGIALQQVTLSGLALLVEDPASLAQMLSRLAGDPPNKALSPGDALEERCEDVARLYSALEPAVARARFATLAGAVLSLEPAQRRRLLTGTVLPACVDGRPEGALLRDFPDVDLADALSLLLDVETAAPELLRTALDRLHLSHERREALSPLLEERIRVRQMRDAAGPRHNDAALRERTQQLIRVVTGDAAFDGFAAFDLRIDDDAEKVIAGTDHAISATNLADARLTCVSQLLALTPNPDVAQRLLRQATQLLGELERTKSWTELASRLAALQGSSGALGHSRPEVAAAIGAAIDSFYTPTRFERLLAMYEAGAEERVTANLLITAAGTSLTPAVVRGLQDAAHDKRILQLVCDHAATFAPVLARLLDEFAVPQRVAAIRALGAAGRGYELQIARQLSQNNELVVRETLRALAQVGSNEAAEFVTRYLLRCGADAELSAEEALWHFSPTATHHSLRGLLRQRQFVISNPDMTLRILERTDCFEPSKLADVLVPLMSLRFRFWNRRLARIGRRAAILLHR